MFSNGFRRAELTRVVFPKLLRNFGSSPLVRSVKVDLKLLGKLRRETQVQISKASEALQATNNDYDLAIKWIEKDLLISGAKKADKFSGRATTEGLVSLYTSPDKNSASIINLACETDFVSNNENFQELAFQMSDVSARIAGPELSSINIDSILASSIASDPKTTVSSILISAIGKMSENISLKAAFGVNLSSRSGSPSYISTYIHSGNLTVSTSSDPSKKNGKLASIAVLHSEDPQVYTNPEFLRFARRIAQQAAGYKPGYLSPSVPSLNLGSDSDAVFLDMEFMFNTEDQTGRTVGQALSNISKSCNSQVSIKSIAFI
ncbi:Elongation factor Ts, mitochondrial [Smittium mucronatum]|uniref:Elongation factor Ts, mitochondrial n=1 Tax=Smittium mucronatum TaxID=133383 RepID=A0A1R0H3N9_9FUNG|nr:Elongation factor Ts, mitochondrial [Smittium mucronatum]